MLPCDQLNSQFSSVVQFCGWGEEGSDVIRRLFLIITLADLNFMLPGLY